MGNYKIIVYDSVFRRKVKSYILHNVTEEQAAETLQKERERYTWSSGHFCSGSIKKTEGKGKNND